LEVATDFGLHLGDFAAEIVEDAAAGDGVDKKAKVEAVVEIDDRFHPAGDDEAGVAGNEEGTEEDAVDLDIVKVDFDFAGGKDIEGVSILTKGLDGVRERRFFGFEIERLARLRPRREVAGLSCG